MKNGARSLMACMAFVCAAALGLSACASGQQVETQRNGGQVAMRADDAGVSSGAASSAGTTAADPHLHPSTSQGEGDPHASFKSEEAKGQSAPSDSASPVTENGDSVHAEDDVELQAEAGLPEGAEPASGASPGTADEARAALNMSEDYRASFDHGPKGPQYQKYIVLHDTEGEGTASGIVDYWDSNGSGVAAHFVVNKDGSIVQCVPLDRITHHAGYGDAGHNDLYGIMEDDRDDMVGTVPIGDWAPDYGMNAWSVGIEMVHVGGTGYYPEEQLSALDALIAYIDAYFGFQSTIIDHKAWRSGNSDTSPEFAEYLANYQAHRTHN